MIVSKLRALLVLVVHRLSVLFRQGAELVQYEVQTIGGLKAELHEIRSLHQRVAELTDVVAEVLVPLADRDDERLKQALARFDRQSF